jgi:hypothetical protein
MEGLHQKEGGEPMIRAKANTALGYKTLAIWGLVAAVLATLAFVAPALAVRPAKTTLTIMANGVDLSGTVQSSRLSCVDNRNIKLYKQVGKQQNPSIDTLIAQDTSERHGRHGEWSTGNTGISGKFYVRTSKVPGCTGATSNTIIARR